ncbi:unnamed protein product, partial [Laminaria digitata]
FSFSSSLFLAISRFSLFPRPSKPSLSSFASLLATPVPWSLPALSSVCHWRILSLVSLSSRFSISITKNLLGFKFWSPSVFLIRAARTPLCRKSGGCSQHASKKTKQSSNNKS